MKLCERISFRVKVIFQQKFGLFLRCKVLKKFLAVLRLFLLQLKLYSKIRNELILFDLDGSLNVYFEKYLKYVFPNHSKTNQNLLFCVRCSKFCNK